MITNKADAVRGTRSTAPVTVRPTVAARLFVLLLHLPPTAYIVVTDSVPGWARVWLGVWLSLWLLVTVVKSLQNQGSSS